MAVCRLAAQGHADVYSYPLSWAKRCLKACGDVERAELIELAGIIRVSVWGDKEDFEKMTRG